MGEDARFGSAVDGPGPLSTTSSTGRNAETLASIAPRRCSKNWQFMKKEQQEASGTRTADPCVSLSLRRKEVR